MPCCHRKKCSARLPAQGLPGKGGPPTHLGALARTPIWFLASGGNRENCGRPRGCGGNWPKGAGVRGCRLRTGRVGETVPGVGVVSDHVADQVSRADLRDVTDEKIRRLALELDLIGDFNPYMYLPPGPVAQAFINDPTPTDVIMGPLGAGKTTACVFKRITAATWAPIAWHPEDGKPTRMCRWIVLRDTFRSTEKTVLESWKQWFPKSYPGSNSAGGNDRPLVHALKFLGQDGVRVEAITEFAGLGENSIETLMKGREYSGAWLNELDTHAEGALDDMEQRVGRYPKADILLTERELEQLGQQLEHAVVSSPRRQKTVIGDMNAPTLDNWTYETLVVNRGPDRAFHQQPSGRSPDAENLFNLEPDYYERIIANQEERFVRRMVDNQFGYSRAGRPVYATFDDRRHVAASPIAFKPDLDLHVGIDTSTAGLSPAAMFAQVAVRISFLDELWAGQGVGPARFGERMRAHFEEFYPNLQRSRLKLWFDPAAFGGNDSEAGQQHAAEIISSTLGVPALIPGSGSNEISLRLKAMETEFRGYLEPNTSILVSPRCKLWIQAAAGKYRFKKKPDSATNEYEDLPEKAHPWSDLPDAGQYVVIGIRGHRAVMTGERQQGGQQWSSQSGERQQGWKSQGGFDPHRVGVKR